MLPVNSNIFGGKQLEMKKKHLSVTAKLLALAAIITSCYKAIPEESDIPQQGSYSSRLHLRITGDTRSSISPDEYRAEEICVMAYNEKDGRLAAIQTCKNAEDIDIELTSGAYNIYVTANMGTFAAPADESEMDMASHRISSFAELGNALPMCWKGKAEIKAGETTVVHASLSRLVSRISFGVETGILEGLEIDSVILCQGAGILRPFMEGGSRIISSEETLNGDHATEEDIARLMKGESICFYAVENCQGILLPDNTDPWTKVPDNIGEKADLCTFVEMRGRWNDDADYEGYVTYRFYLGEDATSSFDLKRNSLHNLTLYLEEESLDRISWKIDASQMDILRWEVYSSLNGNFHNKDNFYVTENIRIDFSFDEKGQKYWNRRDNAFCLKGIGKGGNTVIRFREPVETADGKYYSMGTCVSAGEYDIVLMDSNTGEIEYIMEEGRVYTPMVMAGSGGSFTDSPVKGFDKDMEFMINGKYQDICLYLTDKDGMNLNQGHYYGCDFSICDWNIDIFNDSNGYSLMDKLSIETSEGESGNDSYAIRYRVAVPNDGRNSSWNSRLTGSLGRDMLLFSYEDGVSGAMGKHRIGLYCEDIEITFRPVPDNRKTLMGTEFMYAVDNPSNLPIEIKGLKLNSMSKDPFQPDIRPMLCSPISGLKSDDPLLVSHMPPVICSLEEGASISAIIDGQRCFAADDNGIGQEDIPDQWAMFHTLKARFIYEPEVWTPDFSCQTDLYGSYQHNIMYGEDGYMNCGIILHAYGDTFEDLDSNNGRRTDFKKYGTLLNKEYIDRINDIIIVDISINEKNALTATASRDADLKISVSGKLKGHIRCVTVQDPFYTIWGKYYKYDQPFSNTMTVKAGSTPVAIDGNALAGSFEKMRAVQYYSVLDAWDEEEFRDPYTMTGTVREYLKPYDIDLEIGITSTDGTPVAVRFSGSATYDYKTSRAVTWSTGLFSSVTMVPSSYSGFDSRLDDDDCPPGSLFKAELLNLQPDITYSNSQNIYYMAR